MKAAVLAAAFLFSQVTLAQAQTPAAAPVIQTPSTSKELVEEQTPQPQARPEAVAPKPKPVPAPTPQRDSSPSPRRLHQHSFGVGLGETFLLGKYDSYGDDEITLDLLYTYAASYSFDLLLDAHYSSSEDDDETMVIMGLAGAIKSRLFEFDNFSPYVLGGLGFYAPKAQRRVGGDLEWTTQKVTFGANFGGGVDLRLNDVWTVGALGQLHWPFKVEQDSGTDLRGYYFKLLLTLAYSF